MKTYFLHSFNHLGQSSSCHGVSDLYTSKSKPHQLFWLISLLLAFAAIIYNFVVITNIYIDNPTATKISEISVSRLPFPNITVCSLGQFSLKNYMPKWNIMASLFSKSFGNVSDPLNFGGWLQSVQGTFDMEFDMSDSNVKMWERQYELAFNKSFPNGLKWDIQDFIRSTAIQCVDMFSVCKLGMKTFNCCSRVEPVFTTFGVCYHLTPKPKQANLTYPIQTLSGMNGGLHLQLLHNSSDQPVFPLSNNYQKGFYITIAPYYSITESDTASVAPNCYAYVSLNPIYRLLNPVKRSCTTVPIPIGPLSSSNIYSYRLCQDKCFYNASQYMSGCYTLSPYLEVDSSNVCNPLAVINALELLTESESSKMEDASLNCANYYCKQLCEYWSYSPSVSYSEMVSKLNISGVQTAAVEIYFQQLSYTMVTIFY